MGDTSQDTGPYELIEITTEGPITIAHVASEEWAIQLVAMLSANLGEQGRHFAYIASAQEGRARPTQEGTQEGTQERP